MARYSLIAAVGSPLTPQQGLHAEGLERHLNDCWGSGLSGILVAGTMGYMQLLTDETYRNLAESAIRVSQGRGEVFIGAGDTSLARTRARIAFLNHLRFDGVVVLPPYFFNFSQPELIDYYEALADHSKLPLYLYDLPGRTRTKLSIETVLKLSQHANIAGIKISEDFAFARQVRDVADPGFRVILAAPDLIDIFMQSGFREHLDGMFAVAPAWTVAIARHAESGDWAGAAVWQKKLTRLKDQLVQHGVLPAFTAIMNARGIPGSMAPLPFRELTAVGREALLASPIVQELLRGASSE